MNTFRETYAATKGISPISSWDSFSLINTAYADKEGKRKYTEKDRGKGNGLGNHSKDRKEHGKRDTIWKDIHEISAGFTLLLVFLHIGGVALSSRAHNENLINSMITGKKTLRTP